MERDIHGPQKKNSKNSPLNRESEDDALTQSSPTDSRSDEKLIVNSQRGNKTVNEPSQTAAHTSEGSNYDDEIIDQVQDSDE